MKSDIFSRLAAWFLKYRYWLLCLVVIILVSFRIDNSLWVGDFWEHSSVIRELATHPLNPQHPQLLLDAPSAFNSPYHLVLALVSRWSGYSAVEVLARAGLFNLLLFFIGFYLFIGIVAPKERPGVAFYGLLLIMLLWGAAAWNFSGFYNLRNLGRIAPYPSMFAMGLSMVTLALNQYRLQTRRIIWLLPILFFATIILLTHQITFFFLAAGLAAMSLRARDSTMIDLLEVGGVLLTSLVLALLWPYYPFLRLLLGESAIYHASNQDMYNHVLIRTWPVLIGIPLLVLEGRRDWRSPLPWMFGMLLGVYLFGWITGAYSYGRVISYMAVILQVTIAIYLSQLEVKLFSSVKSPQFWQAAFSIGFMLLLAAFSFRPFVSPLLETVAPEDTNPLEKYYFLSQYTGQYDVILTQLPSSMVVPTFGGKVVAYDRPLAFVPDAMQRRQDVLRFFNPQTGEKEREAILKNYGVKFILLEKNELSDWETVRPLLAPFSELIYRGKRFLLYQVDPKAIAMP
jgi:hypothetical protein